MAEKNLKSLHSLFTMTHRHFSRLQTPISLDLALVLSLFPLLPRSLFLETLQCLLALSQLSVCVTGVCFKFAVFHAVLPALCMQSSLGLLRRCIIIPNCRNWTQYFQPFCAIYYKQHRQRKCLAHSLWNIIRPWKFLLLASASNFSTPLIWQPALIMK